MTSDVIRPIARGVLVATVLTLNLPTVLRAQVTDSEQTFDSAFGHHGGPARLLGPLFRILHRLNLTPDQRGQIRQILQGHRDDFQTLMRRAIEARRPLFEAVFIDPFDEGVIRGRSADVAAVQADGAVLRATIRTEIFEVLTPDQRARAIELLKELEHRRDEGLDSLSDR